MTLPPALAALTACRQFILYLLVPKADGKTDKLPVDHRTLQVFKRNDGWQTDPTAWTDAVTAANLVATLGPDYGIGFFFTDNDPFFFLDIDNCLVNNQWSDIAQTLCASFPGAAIEVSQSGTGLHIFGKYTVVPPHGCKNTALGLELYTSKRFVALTGVNTVGDAGTDCTLMLPGVISQYFPASEEPDAPVSDGPAPEWNGPTDDDELIAKMLAGKGSAAQVFGNKASIKDLWEGNEQALATAYPPLNNRDPYDRSSADNALANHLAFWTGRDQARIDRLMRRSALVRPKWDSHKTYMSTTISGASASTRNVYSSGPAKVEQPVKIVTPVSSEPVMTVGPQILTPDQIKDYFKGIIYIQDRHRMLMPGGAILKPEQFKATLGGYDFVINVDGKTTHNAFEAFVENQAIRFPKVTTTCFRPEIPSCSVITEENRTLVNTYVPIITKRRKGDPSPFLRHLDKLFPDPRDREIITTYMAALVQNPGKKFQWCPMIQGGEGNGKTLIANAMAFAVGNRYTHKPTAQDLGNPFNAWMLEKLLIIIEEIFTSHKRELAERMKPMVTNETIEVQAKGIDQVTVDNRANFLTFTNHKDAIVLSVDGRRYSIFFTPQQTAMDLETWGMGGDYFPKLYAWMRETGYEIVNEFLQTYDLYAEFNPAGNCQRAPQTTSSQEGYELGVGAVEQEILEAVSQDRPGFAGGWISSTALDKLLVSIRAERQIPINKRRIMLQALGYDWHPALTNGRVNNVILAEGSKPRLFIHKDHIHRLGLTTTTAVVDAYLKAQKYPNLAIDAQVNKA